MPKKNSRTTKKRRQSTPLSGHRRNRKRLDAPFSGLDVPMDPVSWSKELLPEFLWIHLVLSKYGIGAFHSALDYLDQYADPKNETLLGTISSFNLIPLESRAHVISEMPSGVKEVFRAWSDVAKLYPEMPGAWLFLDPTISEDSADLDSTLAKLKSMIMEIFASHTTEATMPRAAAMARLVKSGKFRTFNSEMIDELAGYPQENQDELRKTESLIRASTLALLSFRTDMGDWAKYFWQQNFKISVCEKPTEQIRIGAKSSSEVARQVLQYGNEFERDQRELLNTATGQITFDLFAPLRHEVIMGILSRQFRLFCAVLTDVQFWSEDIGSHPVRSMLENLLVLKYLETDQPLYGRFAEYGLGQLKLYKGHLQDLEESQDIPNPALSELLDHLESVINAEMSEEFLPINLGSWSSKSERAIAVQVGMEDDYKFIYQPCSMDVHGQWPSITKWNMLRCRNPLHHFHHLPDFGRPSFPVPGSFFPVASNLFEETIYNVVGALDFKMSADEILAPLTQLCENLTEILSANATESSEGNST